MEEKLIKNQELLGEEKKINKIKRQIRILVISIILLALVIFATVYVTLIRVYMELPIINQLK